MNIVRSRSEFEAEEQARLAPFASRSADALPRVADEPPHAYRTAFQRDRDQMSRAEEEEYERSVEETLFRIHIFEQRLKRHEEQAHSNRKYATHEETSEIEVVRFQSDEMGSAEPTETETLLGRHSKEGP